MTLDEEWARFETLVLKGWGERQRFEMKRAFYAGALVTFGLMEKMAPNDNSKEQEAHAIEAWEQLRGEVTAVMREYLRADRARR